MTNLRSYSILIFAVFAVFARTASFSFIGLDDAGYTFRNPFVATGISWANIIESFANFTNGGIWMPFTYISYMADIEVSGFSGIHLASWMHSVNVLIHMLNAVLLLYFAKQLSAALRLNPSFRLLLAAVVFWAIHPLRAEPVSWIACRKELLWVFFALSGLIFWVRSFNKATGPFAAKACQSLTVMLFAAACLCKPTAMCLPVLAAVVHRLLHVFSGQNKEPSKSSRFVAASYVLMFLFAGATGVAAAYSQTHVAGQEAVALFAAPLHHRIVHALSALGFYVRSFFLPIGLHIDCRMTEGVLPLGGVLNLIVFALAFAGLCHKAIGIKIWKCSPAAAACVFCIAWFIVPLAPTLGLFGSFGIEAHADRFTYLPMMAVVFCAMFIPVQGAPNGDCFSGGKKRILLWMAVAVFSVAAYRQTGFWKDDHIAHRRALECDSEHPRAMVHVADAFCARMRNFDKGIELYRKSIALRPKEYVNYRLAYALASRGNREDYQEVKRLGAAVIGDPSLDKRGMMLDALGTAYMAEGDWESAIRFFEASIAAPGRFWPKASTKHKLDQCLERIK
ncbi:MAG: tetratricopeptide repeat protein [Kiritimatiellae bacterium]|nr:tetratricopeptide repeat protein [Kiritimatiellia bacterium]